MAPLASLAFFKNPVVRPWPGQANDSAKFAILQLNSCSDA